MDAGDVGGTPYRVAVRLHAVAVERWAELDAAYITVDLVRLPLDRFLNCVYAWCIERIPEERVEEWVFQLNAPFPWEAEKVMAATTTWEDDGFMEAMGQLMGAKSATGR